MRNEEMDLNTAAVPVIGMTISTEADTCLSVDGSTDIGITAEEQPEITVELQDQDVMMTVGIEPGTVIPAARKLITPRRIRLTGSADGETMFDGSENVDIFTNIATLTNEELEELLR